MQKTFLVFLLSSLVLLGCSSGEVGSPSAKRFVGLSAFSSMNPSFPCDEYLNLVNQSPMPIMPVLYGTFGFDWSCIEKFIESNRGRPHAVEIHLSNERCRYYERCDIGELEGDLNTEEYNHFLEAEAVWLLKKITDRVQTIYQVLGFITQQHRAPTMLFLSTGLEDLYTQKAYEVLYKTIRKVWPHEIIRVPLQDNTHYDYVEYHGVQIPCTETTFSSNDGVALSMSDIAEYAYDHLGCKATILWLPDLQGVTREFTRPLDRTFRFHPGDIALWNIFLTLLDG